MPALKTVDTAVTNVSIGMPVYNGAQFLPQAFDAILAQTYRDFELVISDNASNDATEAICRDYAARDPRIRYYRSAKNRGVGWNYNRVAGLSSGNFFLWLAHDDLLAPEYVQRCVEQLESDPEAVLCCSNELVIDDSGRVLGPREQIEFCTSEKPHDRFRQMIDMRHNCDAIYGVMRLSVLKALPFIGGFADWDRCVLAELALHGRFQRISAHLFFHREHKERVTRKYPTRQIRTLIEAGMADRALRFVFPHFRQLREYILAIHRAPISLIEKLRCYGQMLSWMHENAGRLWNDLRFVALQTVRPTLREQPDQ